MYDHTSQNDKKNPRLIRTNQVPFEHHMVREIHEQPAVLHRLLAHYAPDGNVAINPVLIHALQTADTIQIIACGTSYHAGLVGKILFEKIAHKKTEVQLASEFNYQEPMLNQNSVFLLISQSGETADLRVTLAKIKPLHLPIYTITNVDHSTLARETDATLLLHAGPELAIASTKAYTAQVALLALLAQSLAPEHDLVAELKTITFLMEDVLAQQEKIKGIVQTMLFAPRDALYLGRGLDYALCLEAALKLKEASYIHAEAIPSGEIKHGPIALIEPGTPVFFLLTQASTESVTRANLQEVQAQGAATATIVLASLQKDGDAIILPDCHPLLTPLLGAIAIQFIAYYAAVLKGTNVDHPRSLSKAVTTE